MQNSCKYNFQFIRFFYLYILLSNLYNLEILQTSHLEPCLDDCVMFGRKLKTLGNQVTLDIVSDLPHGFMNLAVVGIYLFNR